MATALKEEAVAKTVECLEKLQGIKVDSVHGGGPFYTLYFRADTIQDLSNLMAKTVEWWGFPNPTGTAYQSNPTAIRCSEDGGSILFSLKFDINDARALAKTSNE